MIDRDFRLDYMIASRDPGLSLIIMQLVKDLRTFARAVQTKLEELEEYPSPNKGIDPSGTGNFGDHPERDPKAGKEGILFGVGRIVCAG